MPSQEQSAPSTKPAVKAAPKKKKAAGGC